MTTLRHFTGASEPIVENPRGRSDFLSYRRAMGMVPSAEFAVFFDDFFSFVVATAITNGPAANTPWGWQSAIIDAGATAVVDTTAALGATGVLLLSDATASEGVAIYGTKSIQLTAGKRFYMETRVYMNDVTDNTMFFGLSDLTSVTNPEDLWTTASANVATYGILDPATTTTYLADKGNAGTAAVAGTLMPEAGVWNTFAIGFDGAGLRFFLNGILDSYTSTTVPTGVALAPFFGARNGNGAGGNLNYFDYVRYVIER